MTETRTAYLYAAIKTAPGPITTADAEQVLAASPFSCHRNSARKSLRSLTRQGHLTARDTHAGRIYLINTQRSAA